MFQFADRLGNHETIDSELVCYIMKHNLSGYKAYWYYRTELHKLLFAEH
jgi:hypothetical protein